MKDLTINNIIKTLKVSGINSKRKTIEKLENASINDLQCLKRDIEEKIALKEIKKWN